MHWFFEHWIALLALVISGWNFFDGYWRSVRGRVEDLLDDLTSGEAATARDVVGRASRASSLTDDEATEVRSAVFLLLWRLERLEVLKDAINGKSIAVQEARLLYRHVERITTEIDNLLATHSDLGDFNDSLIAANEALASLKPIKNSFHKEISAAPVVRFTIPPQRQLPTAIDLASE